MAVQLFPLADPKYSLAVDFDEELIPSQIVLWICPSDRPDFEEYRSEQTIRLDELGDPQYRRDPRALRDLRKQLSKEYFTQHKPSRKHGRTSPLDMVEFASMLRSYCQGWYDAYLLHLERQVTRAVHDAACRANPDL